MNKKRKELLGYVGVDSGQLMIIDPCYLRGVDVSKGNVIGLKFWGKDADELAKYLKENTLYMVEGNYPYIISANDKDIEEINDSIRDIKRREGFYVVSSTQLDSTYDKIGMLTNNENQGGEVDYGVAFTSGLGDGNYEVFANYEEIDGWGERITKVEIVLIDPNEEF